MSSELIRRQESPMAVAPLLYTVRLLRDWLICGAKFTAIHHILYVEHDCEVELC